MSSAYNPNKQGWGFAAVVCLITAGLFFTAKTIHARTYRNPRDPMAQQVYFERDAAKRATSGEHAAPAAEHVMPTGQPMADSAKPPAEASKH